MAVDQLDRLLAKLNISGLQQKNTPLYEIISELIKRVKVLSVEESSSSTSTIENITQIQQFLSSDSDSSSGGGEDGPPGQSGLKGDTGLTGASGPLTLGPMGLDGIDGEEGMPIPGPRGQTGLTGLTGAAGPPTLGPMGIEESYIEENITQIIQPGGDSSGGGTSSGVEADLPASGNDGELYLPTDGVYIHRYNGSSWAQWGPIFPLVEPIDSDFTWINQGGASVVTTFGGVYLLGPAGAGINWRIRKKAAPATPYVITTAILTDGLSEDFHQIGLIFRESGSGSLHVFTYQVNGVTLLPVFNSVKYSSPTVFSGVYLQSRYQASKLLFLRIADDGVNRICSYSPDGQNWLVFDTRGRTDFITADEVGFAVNAESGTFGVGINLISWKES